MRLGSEDREHREHRAGGSRKRATVYVPRDYIIDAERA
jgi:hypothetical protein